MDLPALIDVALGLIFLYLLLSLICTSVNEGIASVTRLRARVLHREIGAILDDPELRAAFWRDGTIRSLSRAGAGIGALFGLGAPAERPSQIPPGKAPSYLGGVDFARAALRAVEARQGAEGEGGLASKIGGGGVLRDALTAIEARAEGAAARMEAELAAWFDDVMTRTGGTYKRCIGAISFVVALLICTAINADTIAIARALWQDDALRAQIAAAAALEVPAQSGADDADPALTLTVEAARARLAAFPLGWETPPCAAEVCPTWHDDPGGILSKAVGVLLTAFAVTLGAPFWFDLLSRIATLRAAGQGARSSAAPAGGNAPAAPGDAAAGAGR